MRNLLIQIGEHSVYVSSNSERSINWLKKYFKIIKWDIPSKNDFVDLSIDIQEGYGVSFVDYQMDITSNSNKIIYRRADYLIEVNTEYNDAVISVYDELALKHALTNLFSAFIVHIRWGLLIHSSCVEHQGHAYLFAGHSGAGKSTVARLSNPRPILSDEATLVKIGANDITVFDSPFRSELTTPYFHDSCVLSKIHLLIQSTDIKTMVVKKPDALLELLDKIFFWSHDPLETVKVLQMCRQLVDRVPAYNMYFQKNNRFWEMIS